MIKDSIKNYERYLSVNSGIKEGFDFILNNNFNHMEDGKYSIDGDKIFAIVSTYQTKEKTDSQPEAHNRYLDIQFVAHGSECMGYKSREDELSVSKAYSEENDILFYDEEAVLIPFEQGDFFILFPNDLHQPGITFEQKKEVKKVVVKILCD